MKAMVLKKIKTPLELIDIPIPKPEDNQILIRIFTCGVCRTDLHIWEGELTSPQLPLVLGHQIIGVVVELGKNVKQFKVGQRVGVPWLNRCCEQCEYCKAGKENLCTNALYTGYQVNGGYAEYCVAYEEFVFPVSSEFSPEEAAPLLCAGLIGYRSYRLSNHPKKLGLYGFGSAAHLIAQIATKQDCECYAFTKNGDIEAQIFAKKSGCVWSGNSDDLPPEELDSAIIFASGGELIPLALKTIKKGGRVICAGIHMTDIPSFPYSLLYGEKTIQSVTNLTREDGEQFFLLLKSIKISPKINIYSLEEANQALMDLKEGKLTGSAVLVVSTKTNE